MTEYAAALSWLARGALTMKDWEACSRYLTRTKALVSDLLKTSRVEDDAFLATAAGTSIEVEARMLAAQDKRDKAVALLETELPRWKLWTIQARIQKNIDMLTLEGKAAPEPTQATAANQFCFSCGRSGAATASAGAGDRANQAKI